MGKQIRISNTEIMSRIFATRVTGTITLPAQTGNLKKFACTNITVVATSKAKMIAGQCTYSINVPAFSQFYLTASGHGRGSRAVDRCLAHPDGRRSRTVQRRPWG